MASSSPVVEDSDGFGSSSEAAQAALQALYSMTCDTGFVTIGLQDGEAAVTPIRVLCTLVTMSVASAWFTRRESIRKLLLFFSHWLSGMLYQLVIFIMATMISVCRTGSNHPNLIKAFKFIELASSNMLATTNLAICVNLALVVMSHRPLARVNSLSSPTVILVSFVISVGAAASAVPSWEVTIVSGTGFFPTNAEQRGRDWIAISRFFLEMIVGICMFAIVAWLLMFRMRAIKECWKMHARIRYYFCLTIIATAVNLALGICGIIHVAVKRQALLIVLTWTFRHIHIALDTIVLYAVLAAPAKQFDEHPGSRRPGPPVGSGVISVSRVYRTSSRPPSSNNNNNRRLRSTDESSKRTSSKRAVARSSPIGRPISKVQLLCQDIEKNERPSNRGLNSNGMVGMSKQSSRKNGRVSFSDRDSP